MRKLMSIMAVLVMSVLLVSMVSALTTADVKFSEIEVNGVELTFDDDADVESNNRVAIEEGEQIDVRVELEAGNGATDIQVEADISGYEYDDYTELEDTTHVFTIQKGDTLPKTLHLNMPTKLDKDEYWLRLRIMDKKSATVEKVVKLSVEPKRHAIDVKDVAFSPSSTVKAGRTLLATVLLENYGDKHEKDVKVTVTIPALGVSATEFMDVVAMDDKNGLNNIDYEDVPEVFLPIPADAAAGEYKVDVVVKYDDLRETVTKSYNVNVAENEMFKTSDKLVLAVGPEFQTVAQGNSVTYGVALTNAGSASKAYTVSAVSGNGVTASVSESLAVLGAGENKVVYVTVTPGANTPVGEQVVSVTIKSGSETLETVALRASVVAGSDNFNLRNGLEIALIVLVVLLVVIGLIVGFSRLKRDDEEEQTYY